MIRSLKIEREKMDKKLIKNGKKEKEVNERNGDRIMCDEEEESLGRRRNLVNKVEIELEIMVVERRVKLVKKEDRRGIGEEERKNKRNGGKWMIKEGKKSNSMRIIEGREGKNLKKGLKRIIDLDKLKLRSKEKEKMSE